MAEALLNSIYGFRYKAYSAGLKKTSVNSYAAEVLKEIGVDLSNHYSKTIDEFQDMNFDIVVTVCDNAKENCPFFPGKQVVHKSFDDPGLFEGGVEETLDVFRRSRDEIRKWIIDFF